jgi:hypothetical protein
MSKKIKRQIIWEWVTPGASILAAVLLVEISHLSQGWWRYPLDMLGWGVVGLGFFESWRRWRQAEIELIRRVWLPQGHKPHISLLTGQDLACGMPVVVNDRGFVITPDKSPYPPTREPHVGYRVRRGR